MIASTNDATARLHGFCDGEVPDRVSNSERFTVESVDRKKCTVTLAFRYDISKTAVLAYDSLVRCYELDYAITSHRSQSITIDERVQVHLERAQSMTFESIYVAISRNRRFDQLSFVCVDEGQRYELAGSRIDRIPYNTISIANNTVLPLSALVYSYTMESMTYIGCTMMDDTYIAEHGWDAAVVLADQKRFSQHVAAGKSRVEHMITKVGQKNVKRAVLYSGHYKDRRTLEADETYYINQVPSTSSLNDRQRSNIVTKKNNKTTLTRSQITQVVIKKDVILPKIGTKGQSCFIITYFTTEGVREYVRVHKSMKRGRDGVGRENTNATDAKMRTEFSSIVQTFYNPQMFPGDDPAAYVESQLVAYRQ
jgi:hypothetical protein